jgi:hypothetical protein
MLPIRESTLMQTTVEEWEPGQGLGQELELELEQEQRQTPDRYSLLV